MKFQKYIKASEHWKAPERDLSSVLLDLNENQFLNSFLTEFIANDLKARDLFTYPNYQPLLDALGGYCKVSTDNVLLTNGADQAIDLVIRLLFSPGDRVVIPSPVFSFYYQMLSVNGVEPVTLAFQKCEEGFVLPTQAILDALPNSHGLILCNPNNPLGVRIEPINLRVLVERCIKLNKPMIVDECYFEYLQQSCLDEFKDVRQLFVIRSFSKYFGLAGLRLGYVVTSPPSVREMLKVRGPWDINHAAVKAALFCLNNLGVLEAGHRQLRRVKNELIEFCRAHGVVVFDTNTNFLLIKEQSGYLLAKALKQARICVNDCSQYPYSFGLLESILRVTVPAPSDLQAFMFAIKRATDKHRLN